MRPQGGLRALEEVPPGHAVVSAGAGGPGGTHQESPQPRRRQRTTTHSCHAQCRAPAEDSNHEDTRGPSALKSTFPTTPTLSAQATATAARAVREVFVSVRSDTKRSPATYPLLDGIEPAVRRNATTLTSSTVAAAASVQIVAFIMAEWWAIDARV